MVIRALLRLMLLVWEIPQNIVGFAVYAVACSFRRCLCEPAGTRFFIRANFGISLGMFVFWLETVPANKRHEYGHAMQSMMLGPLYLFVIGIPSVLRVLYGLWYFQKHRKHWTRYYTGFPENWADYLGQRFSF